MKKTPGVTGAVLLALGVLAGPAQAFLVEGPRGPSAAGSVYELPLTPFGGAAYHALLSSEKYGFSSPSAFLHLGAGTWTDATALGGSGRTGTAPSSPAPCATSGERGVGCSPADFPGVVPARLDPAHRSSPWAGTEFPRTGGPPHPGLIPAHPGRDTPGAALVPEPSTLLLLGSGLVGLGGVVWRRHRRG